MQHLGHTRSSYQRDHLLQTPDTFIRAPLPGMRNATAIVHTGPAGGAGFTQYSVEFEPNGSFETGSAQTFVYVLGGALTLALKDDEYHLRAAEYGWIPPDCGARIIAAERARAAVIEKPFAALNGCTPAQFTGDEQLIASKPLLGDEAVEVRVLLPDDAAFDCAVNTM